MAAASSLSAVVGRLRETALSLESRHREAAVSGTGSVMSLSPRTTRASSPQLLRTSPRSPRTPPIGQQQSPRARMEVVFDLMRDGDPRGVSLAALSQGLVRHDLPLEPAELEGIFRRADTDGDKILSRAEFLEMSRNYPTLISCLYTRAARRQKEQQAANTLVSAKSKLTALKESDERALKDIEEARTALGQKREALKMKQAAAVDEEAKLRVAKSTLDTHSEQAQAANGEAHAANSLLGRSKRNAQQAATDLQTADQRKETAARHLRSHEEKEAGIEERLRELQAHVAEQQQELERQKARTQRAAREAEQARQSKEAAEKVLETCNKEVRQVEKRLQDVEAKLAAAAAREQESEQVLQTCKRRVEELLGDRDAAEREVQALSLHLDDAEEKRRIREAPTQKEVLEQQEVVESLQCDADTLRSKRRRAEEEELPVVQMEVRLRRQREVLEEEERMLRTRREALDGNGSDVRNHPITPPTHATRYTADPLADDLLTPKIAKHISAFSISSSPGRSRSRYSRLG